MLAEKGLEGLEVVERCWIRSNSRLANLAERRTD